MSRETSGALLFGIGMIVAFGVTLGLLKRTPPRVAVAQPAGAFADRSLAPRMDDALLAAPDAPSGGPGTSLPSLRRPLRKQFYTVRAKDSLSKIARAFYGPEMGHQYRRILEANRETLPDAETLREGQVLVIPPLPEEKPAGDRIQASLGPSLPGRSYASAGRGR